MMDKLVILFATLTLQNQYVSSASLETYPQTVISVDAPMSHNNPAVGSLIKYTGATDFIARSSNSSNIQYQSTSEGLYTNTIGEQSYKPGKLPYRNLAKYEVLSDAFRANEIQRLAAGLKRVGETIHFKYNEHLEGEVEKIPWPGAYWPMHRDSINHRWAGKNISSPAEKYAMAFGHDVAQFTKSVSEQRGVLSIGIDIPNAVQCHFHEECGEREKCAKRLGEEVGYCTFSWAGICHAWAPASIAEPEPKCPVTVNGTTFSVRDVMALITMFYDDPGLPMNFMGARFNGRENDEDMDEFGRYLAYERRDIGPGFLHLLVTNIVGRLKKSFIVDVDNSLAVWNQPVRSYSIEEIPDIDPMTYFNGTYHFNPQATKLKALRMKFRYIDESTLDQPLVATGFVDKETHEKIYEYILELNDKDEVLGGEWIGESRYDHPDYAWYIHEWKTPQPDHQTNLGLVYSEVKELVEQSANGNCTVAIPVFEDNGCGSLSDGPQACPEQQYCQPWNPNFFQCKYGNECGVPESFVDFYGSDIDVVYGLFPWDCCERCQNTKGCKAYTFVNYNDYGGPTECFLKSGVGEKVHHPFAISGTI